jgi:hypothetical protein
MCSHVTLDRKKHGAKAHTDRLARRARAGIVTLDPSNLPDEDPLIWYGILDTSFSKIFVGRHTKTKSSGLAYSLCACGALHVWGTVIKGVVFSYICFGHNIQTPSQGQKKKREETLSCVFI